MARMTEIGDMDGHGGWITGPIIEATCNHPTWECKDGVHECTDCDINYWTKHPENLTNASVNSIGAVCHLCKGQPPVGKYTTKDSGKREEYDSGMRRDTQEGKPRWDLLFIDGLPYEEQPQYRHAALLDRGAQKYGEKNYLLADSVQEYNRFKASAARHFAQFMAGETDEDHFAAVRFNMDLMIYLEYKIGKDKLQGG